MLSQFGPVAPLMLSTLIMLTGSGLAGLLLPLRALEEGWSPTLIGWLGTFYSIAFTAGCYFVPRLVLRVGHVRVFAVLTTLLAISLLLHALLVDVRAWMVIRGIAGFSIAGSYMVIESWLNERVTNDNRGLIFSVYMIASMLGLVIGQYLMAAGDPMTATMFMVAAIFYGLALLPTALSSAASPQPLTQVSLDLVGLYKNSPAAAVGSFLAGVIAGNWNYLAPIYGQQIGLTPVSTATMLAAAMLGGALFQIPLGRASDLIDRRLVMVIAGIIGVVMSLVMIFMKPDAPWLIFIGVFFFGAVLFPIYSLNVAHANDHADTNDFVKIAGGILFMNGIGSMTGAQLGGRFMEWMGPNGFFVVMASIFGLYAAHSFWRTMQREAMEPDERTDFQTIALPRQQTPETFQLDPRIEEVDQEDRMMSGS